MATIENIYYQAKNHIKVNFNYYNNTKMNITDTITIPIVEDVSVFETAYQAITEYIFNHLVCEHDEKKEITTHHHDDQTNEIIFHVICTRCGAEADLRVPFNPEKSLKQEMEELIWFTPDEQPKVATILQD
ncbi:hypothetical protein [Spiroplasma eriocheiris]|uniref:Uncharacterized protein n=1 Tax=Spiroplasma eriocheiris TaxID=315358 RepID=A0A0H3XLI0_9MOLU|nr:hypothetical protein [Spiroplasma eriocheiris]AHF57932.1 hypothetical protein SPE_0810 [Spiroplasma eriocheiris CCTCC M 207170]AKM54374.1 hypothetical protein SERIO_v1c08120 [Spiroplasma eriocheiris]